MATKPSSHLDWVESTPSARTEPSVSKKNTGWAPDERPPSEFFNWLFYQQDQWAKYFEEVTDEQGHNNIHAIVNVDPLKGTHETLEAALADAVVQPGSKILITSDLEINANIQISKQDIEIEMRPGYAIKKAAAAPDGLRGLEVVSTANRLRLKHVKLEGFDGAGDVGLWLDVSASNVLLFNMIYAAGMTQNFENNSNNSYEETLTMDL